MTSKEQPDRVKLVIDGQDVSVERGGTILNAATAAGIRIPTLCHLEGLPEAAACRICVVDVNGQWLPACATEAVDGMRVVTVTPEIEAHRRSVVELLFAEGNHVCSFCVSNGNCELQDLACEVGLQSVRVPYSYRRDRIDASHPAFLVDRDRCVLCGRCVRVCAEVEGAHTWAFAGRGTDARVITDLWETWDDAESCTSCGKCVEACPTGAIVVKGASNAEMVKDRELAGDLVVRRARG